MPDNEMPPSIFRPIGPEDTSRKTENIFQQFSERLAAGEPGVDLSPMNDAPPSEEPPPPASEGDYGDNVVPIKRKRAPRGEGTAYFKDGWQLSSDGQPLCNAFNARLALSGHPEIAGAVGYDEMSHTCMLLKQIPGSSDHSPVPRNMTDSDCVSLQIFLQQIGLRRITKGVVQDAIDEITMDNKFHPVRDMLTGLEWDGETRVAGWLSRYLGCEGGRYADTIGAMFLVSLIARVMEPGCQSDYMLILEGGQGAGKSSACRVLAGEWFSDNIPDLARGDAVRLSMHLRGKWLVEIAEMSSFSNAESHKLKEFLTQTHERYVPKYGRREVIEPRQCVFIGSTNEGEYLRDATGGRRFWPVKVGDIDLDALKADRLQILAEALMMYRSGAPRYPSKDFEAEFIKPEQEDRYECDAWEDAFNEWVKREGIWKTTVNQVLRHAIGMDVQKIGTREQRRVVAILQRGVWRKRRSNGVTTYEL